MASRLSTESLKKVYDHGHQGFFRREKDLEIQSVPDLQQIAMHDDRENLIQKFSAQNLYQAFSASGLEESAEVFRFLTSEQWTRICDYSVWVQDRLHPGAILTWLDLAPKVDRSSRFLELEEEVQIAMLSGLVRMFEAHELEDMTDEHQDLLTWFPGREAAYQILSDDPQVCRQIHELIDSLMHDNMAYTMSILMNSTWLPPGEQELLAKQFREARVAEDGFVSWDESQRLFVRLSPESVSGYVSAPMTTSSDLKGWAHKDFLQSFLKTLDGESLASFMLQATTLANGLCTASGLEAGDVRGQKRIFRHGMGLVSLGLEQLSHGDFEKAEVFLQKTHLTQWFQVGLWSIGELQDKLLRSMERFGCDVQKIRRAGHTGRFGVAVTQIEKNFLDFLGHERCEKAKALWNRYPMVAEVNEEGQIYFRSLDGLQDYAILAHMVEEWTALLEYIKQSYAGDCLQSLEAIAKDMCLQAMGSGSDFLAGESWISGLDSHYLQPVFLSALQDLRMAFEEKNSKRGGG
ncbi:MAG: DUF6178 family protein [Oligoflexales bacterium]